MNWERCDEMGTKILRFKNIEEAERLKWKKIIEDGQPYWENDRFEYARLHTKFTPGVHRFRTLKEKKDWELKEICEKWKLQK